ncbi:MAG: hypothetical protein ACJAYS_000343 [Lentimonas sp.]|jgi:hypothetical protein
MCVIDTDTFGLSHSTIERPRKQVTAFFVELVAFFRREAAKGIAIFIAADRNASEHFGRCI